MKTWHRLVLQWWAACGISALIRMVTAYVYPVWDTEGRLLITPQEYALLAAAQIAVAGSVFLMMVFLPSHPWGRR